MRDILLFALNSLSGRSSLFDNIIIYGIPVIFLVLLGLILFTRSKKLYVITFLSLFVSLIVDLIFNLVMHINRPFVSEIANQIVNISNHAPNSSFPSTHTLIAFSLAFPMVFYSWRRGIFSLCLAFIVGLSRLYLGVHWSTDVLGSIIITLIVTYCVVKVVDDSKYFNFLK